MFLCVENLVAKYCVVIVVETNTTKHQSLCLKVSFNGLTILFINIIYVVQEGRVVQRVLRIFINNIYAVQELRAVQSVWMLLCGTRVFGVLLVGGTRVFLMLLILYYFGVFGRAL